MNAEEAPTNKDIATESTNEWDENDSKRDENLDVKAVEASEENDNDNHEDDIANVDEDENIENTEKSGEIPVQRNDNQLEKDDEKAR